jgi:hypothetical protein
MRSFQRSRRSFLVGVAALGAAGLPLRAGTPVQMLILGDSVDWGQGLAYKLSRFPSKLEVGKSLARDARSAHGLLPKIDSVKRLHDISKDYRYAAETLAPFAFGWTVAVRATP